MTGLLSVTGKPLLSTHGPWTPTRYPCPPAPPRLPTLPLPTPLPTPPPPPFPEHLLCVKSWVTHSHSHLLISFSFLEPHYLSGLIYSRGASCLRWRGKRIKFCRLGRDHVEKWRDQKKPGMRHELGEQPGALRYLGKGHKSSSELLTDKA